MEENNILQAAPSNPSGWVVLAKTTIWFVMGGLIAFLIFIIITLLGRDLFIGGTSTFMPIILALIAFVASFIGNSAVAGAYNLFYSYKYYDFSKMFSFMLLANGFLLLLITPIYFIYGAQGDAVFIILGFHIFLSIFITNSLIEFITNPNYSGSAMLGTFTWFAICSILYLLVVKVSYTNPDKVFFLMMTPSTIWYGLIPFVHAIWEKFYYKFYEAGSDFLYIPSLQEVSVKEEDMENNMEQEDANIDLG